MGPLIAYAALLVGGAMAGNGAATTGCPSPGNLGIFCGDLSGVAPTASGTLGIFVHRFVGVEIEGSLARKRSGSASYDQLAHTDTTITHATFEHSSDRSVSAQLRGRIPLGRSGITFEPVAGVTKAHAVDWLRDQVRVFSRAGFPAETSHPGEAGTKRDAHGVSFGADIISAAKHRVTFAASVRVRWINWPTTGHYYSPNPPQAVPAALTRWSLTLGAGLRWANK